MRGFFLADPEDLSLLALVDQFAPGVPGEGPIFGSSTGTIGLPMRALAGGICGGDGASSRTVAARDRS